MLLKPYLRVYYILLDLVTIWKKFSPVQWHKRQIPGAVFGALESDARKKLEDAHGDYEKEWELPPLRQNSHICE